MKKRELALRNNITLLEEFELDLRKDISNDPNSYNLQCDQTILNKIKELKSELQSTQVESTTQGASEVLIIHSISEKVTELMTALMTSKNIDKPKVIDKPNVLKLYLKIYNNYSDYSPKRAYTIWQNNILPICSDEKLQPKEQLELILIVATMTPELLDEQGTGTELCQIVFDLANKRFDATYFEQLCLASSHCVKNIADSKRRLREIGKLEKKLENNKGSLTEPAKLNIYHAFAASLSKKMLKTISLLMSAKGLLLTYPALLQLVI